MTSRILPPPTLTSLSPPPGGVSAPPPRHEDWGDVAITPSTVTVEDLTFAPDRPSVVNMTMPSPTLSRCDLEALHLQERLLSHTGNHDSVWAAVSTSRSTPPRPARPALAMRDILPRTANAGVSKRWLGTNRSWPNTTAINLPRRPTASRTRSTLPSSVSSRSLTAATRCPLSLKTEAPIRFRTGQAFCTRSSEPAGTLASDRGAGCVAVGDCAKVGLTRRNPTPANVASNSNGLIVFGFR
jgi:hypothetical protein